MPLVLEDVNHSDDGNRHCDTSVQGTPLPGATLSQPPHRFGPLLFLSTLLVCFLVGIVHGRVHCVQTLGPLPVQGTQLPFAASGDTRVT